MAAPERIIVNDGQLATETDITAIGANLEAWLAELMQYLFGGGDLAAYFAGTVPSATDVAGNALPNYGFFGPSFRVVRVSATRVIVTAGLGLQYATSGVPSGERALRFVRLHDDAPEADGATGVTIGSLPTAGQYKRAIVSTKWRDVVIQSAVAVMDSTGDVSNSTQNVRQRPEVGTKDTVTTGITVTYGTAAGSAAGAARPATPSGHVVLAELLLDSTGLANAANPDGNTSGITDLRPLLRPSKAAGGFDSRRATCSMDESTGARNARRMGAKRSGADEVDGWVQIPTGAAAVVTLDSSCDWRDCMVDVTVTALADVNNLPGAASDSAYRRSQRYSQSAVESVNNPGVDRVIFYSQLGSADGSSGPVSDAVLTTADHASTSLIFFADSTSGALKCRGIAGGSNRELYFVAVRRGPLGKHPASGVEA